MMRKRTFSNIHHDLVFFQLALLFMAESADALGQQLPRDHEEIIVGLGVSLLGLKARLKRITDELEMCIYEKEAINESATMNQTRQD